MTHASSRPDLCRIGQSAFMEVLSVLLSLPATIRESSNHCPLPNVPNLDLIASAVHLTGQRISGNVEIQLPGAFVARAIHLLTGLAGDSREAIELRRDTAGELANMIAGRIAVQLAADGYACTLSTPSVSCGVGLPAETESGVDHGRTELFCDGHWLSLELKCRYAVP